MGMDGIAHHVRARSPINLRPTHRAAGIQIHLQLAGKGHISKLDHTLSILQTSYSSTLRGPQRQVDHSMISESVSSWATEPIGGLRLASPKQRTRADRRCRSQDTTCGPVSSHKEAHGGWRRTGRESLGRGIARCFRPHPPTCGTSP